MKILHISNGDDKLGSGRCLMELLEYEKIQGDIIPIVVNPTENGITEFCRNHNIEYHVAPYRSFMYAQHDKQAWAKYLIRKYQYNIEMNVKANYKKLENEINFSDIDLIHTNNCTIDLGIRFSKKYNIQHVWHLRENGLDQWNLRPFVHDLPSYMTSGNTIFLAVSQSVKKEWIEMGIPEDLIDVVYDGVKPPESFFENNEKRDSGIISFVLAGTISESKGQLRVVEALSKLDQDILKRIHVDFWGTGNEKHVKELEDTITQNNLEKYVSYKGFSRHLWKELYKYDCGINASYKEAFGRVTVEYMMMGLPVIASNTGSGPELITDLSKGYVYEHGNLESFLNGIIYITNNIDTYHSNRDLLKMEAISKFSDKTSADNVIHLFRDVADVNNG
jgi:glycosyltransferase involved in cell wall biosynthesis